MDKKQKILVSGDVGGKFKALFARVEAINNKSGPFDFLFCVGDFFGDSAASWQPYKTGQIQVPIATYILGPNKEEHVGFYEDLNGCEMCPNVNYLGKRGLLSSCGLSIAYLSGIEAGQSSATTFSRIDTSELKNIVTRSKIAGSGFLGVDILLTSPWPDKITNLDPGCGIGALRHPSTEIAKLCTDLRPRYHFAGVEDVSYKRAPYGNHMQGNETSVHSTRFVGLPCVGNARKENWLYAASLLPIDQMKPMDLYQSTTDETACPFPNLTNPQQKRQYFYDMDEPEEQGRKRKPRDSETKRQPCWFCLSGELCEKHLVVSVGEVTYLALAKGGMNDYHAMILPIKHHRSLLDAPDDIKIELKKFQTALKKFFKKKGMAPLFFERNFRTSHFQMQVIPLQKSTAGKLKDSFLNTAQEFDIKLDELPDHCKLEDASVANKPYFYAELPTSERLFCDCRKEFPLEFARDVLAGEDLLNLPHRVNWRDCVASKEEETRLTKKFRDEFKEFDFTADDD